MDKEMGWEDIPDDQRAAYRKAMEDHWDEWLRFRSVEILSKQESDRVRQQTSKSRILRSRYALRNKNAGKSDELKAKARLVIAGQNCPDSAAGVLKTDAPTVQRTAVLVLLQVAASMGWLATLAVGDVSSAFLQGKERDVDTLLYMEQPRGLHLAGTETSDCLLRVVKGVFGLPDAPRAWWLEFSKTLTTELGMTPLQQDSAFFTWRHGNGKLGLMLVVHVDDILVVHDASESAQELCRRLAGRPVSFW